VLASDRGTVLYALLAGGVVGAAVGGFLGGVIGAASRGLIFELTPVQQGALGTAVGFLLGAAGLGMLVHATSAWGVLAGGMSVIFNHRESAMVTV
jgi:hypothetical protein